MRQAGLFGLSDHLKRLSAYGDPLETLGRIIDYGVIRARINDLYASAARTLDEPLLVDLVREGEPAYSWPADERSVWRPSARGWLTSLVAFATRPSHAAATS